MKHLTLPDRELLLDLLDYDPAMGLLYWKTKKYKRKAGVVAGGPDMKGHWRVSLNGRRYFSHRIIWKWMTGEDPAGEIDHADLDKGNNAWANLRDGSKSFNMANISARAGSGFKGAYCTNGTWYSCIMHNGISYYLGSFRSAEEANAAYAVKARDLYGEFARAA